MLFSLLLFEHVVHPLKMLHFVYKQYLDGVFVISGISKSKLITLAETLIIADITKKPNFNYCFIIHCCMGNIQKLLCEMQVDFICASKNTRTNAPSGRITRNHSSACAL